MKKVMIGILILIPIIILLVVAMVSTIVSAQAHIAVENIELKYKNSQDTIYELPLSLESVANKVVNIKDYLDVAVFPEKANNYTIEWKISGDVTYTDEEYYKKYRDYLDSSVQTEKVWPAAAFVDENGNETSSNTSGKMVIGSYCTFTMQVVAENVSKTLSVKVVGYDVSRVDLRAQTGNNTLEVGSSVRLLPSYTPIDSIVNQTEWSSSNDSVATVDKNGIVTAVGQGSATITLGASVFSTGEKVYGSFDVTVTATGASVRYGNKIVTSRSSLTLTELGIDESATEIDGCEIVDGIVTVTKDVATLNVDGKVFVIEKCDADAIEIQNKKFYEHTDDGYVLAVGEHTLKLAAIWTDMTNRTELSNVVWTSNNQSVATVGENGEVKGLSNGLVTITATANGKSASVTINVQNKLASVQLRTSDASLAVGLARETVFASQRFANPTNVKSDDSKIANSTRIVVEGEKVGATKEELELFYSAYDFEVVKGGEYAYFDDTIRNMLVFKDEGKALEGKGRQQIVVRVSAKYPKYEGMTKFTTQEVTLNAIFGVAVSSVAELEVASRYQRSYAEADGNRIESKKTFEVINDYDNKTYRVQANPYSKTTYAICFENNVAYTIAEQGENLVGPEDRLNFYGDVYGNNHMLSTETNQLATNTKLMRISWSNVTMSNLILRANSAAQGTEIDSAEDTKDFTGILGLVGSHVNWDIYRLENVKIEYCIFENAKEGINVNNSNVDFDGCIVRNLCYCGIATQARINESDGVLYPYYSHIGMNNFVFSNTLASIMVVNYEHYTTTGKATDYRFAATAEENEKWFMDNFYANGINFRFRQTGFIDAYNWQPVSSASLISVGNVNGINVDDLIAKFSDMIIRGNSAFANRRIIDSNDVCWIHVAIVTAGITTGFTIENTYADVNIQDKRLSYFNTNEMQIEQTSPLAKIGETFLKQASAGIWGYDNQQNIQPSTTYMVNDAFIDRLHTK